MALRNNPYLPLYVNDFLSDERLLMCSAETTGVYIRLMCLMHKSEIYGKILLKQMLKQSSDNIQNFASVLTKQMPYDFPVVKRSLVELLSYNIIAMENDELIQKRMVKDNEISEKRALSGQKGGTNTQIKNFALANDKANSEANTDIDIEDGIEIKKGIVKGKKFSAPSLDEFKAYFKVNGFREDIAERAWNGYSEANWHDSQGKEIKIWKQKCQHVWFKDEHKIKDIPHQTSARQKFLKKAIQILPDSLCIIFEDNFSGRCTPQEAMDFKAGKIDLSYFNREF